MKQDEPHRNFAEGKTEEQVRYDIEVLAEAALAEIEKRRRHEFVASLENQKTSAENRGKNCKRMCLFSLLAATPLVVLSFVQILEGVIPRWLPLLLILLAIYQLFYAGYWKGRQDSIEVDLQLLDDRIKEEHDA